MTPIVFLVVRSEREMQAHLDQFRRYDDEATTHQPDPQPAQKTSKEFSLRLESQKSCQCCE